MGDDAFKKGLKMAVQALDGSGINQLDSSAAEALQEIDLAQGLSCALHNAH